MLPLNKDNALLIGNTKKYTEEKMGKCSRVTFMAITMECGHNIGLI